MFRSSTTFSVAFSTALSLALSIQSFPMAVAAPAPTSPTPPAPVSIEAQADALGAPMIAVKRAMALAGTSTFSNKSVFAVFDISQPTKNKRFFLFDLKNGKVSSFFVAHGRGNGDNFKATKFRGFQSQTDMTPLGPLRTADQTTDMDHYRNITDRYTGEEYTDLVTLWLEGVTSYNSYINDAHDPDGSIVKWIIHPAWYVSQGYRANNPGALGRSLGCIALDPKDANRVELKLRGGALVYVTVGNDPIEKYL